MKTENKILSLAIIVILFFLACLSIQSLSAQPIIVGSYVTQLFDRDIIVVTSTQEAGKVLALEISRDGGTTWEYTGSSAGVYPTNTTTHLSYQTQWWTDDGLPILMFRTVEY